MMLRPIAKLAIGVELLLAIGALGGGLALMAGPHGEIIPLSVSLLSGSPFTSYFVPGAILLLILGVCPLFVALLAWRRHRAAPLATVASGVALIIWIAVEIAIVGYSNHPPLQLAYLALGVAMLLVGMRWSRDAELA